MVLAAGWGVPGRTKVITSGATGAAWDELGVTLATVQTGSVLWRTTVGRS